METEKPINVELNEVQSELAKAMEYLLKTDYVALKIAEALALGEDVSKLVSEYSIVLMNRERCRETVDALRKEEASILEGLE